MCVFYFVLPTGVINHNNIVKTLHSSVFIIYWGIISPVCCQIYSVSALNFAVDTVRVDWASEEGRPNCLPGTSEHSAVVQLLKTLQWPRVSCQSKEAGMELVSFST